MSVRDDFDLRTVFVGTVDDTASAIIGCEAAIRAAQLTADTDALDRLIADDLLFTGPDGEIGTKAQDLAAHRSGVVRFRVHEPQELRVLAVGPDVAVSALRARLAVEVAGTLYHGTYRYTRVWARTGGGSWRVVGGHVSEVRTLDGAGTDEDVNG
jgi:ketosteroid isomerase-like protein